MTFGNIRVVAGLRPAFKTRRREAGVSLTEVMMASAIILITMTGTLTALINGFKTNVWQGDASTRTVEYARDKMEALLGLTYSDATSDTTQSPTCTAYSNPACTLTAPNNTGLGGDMAASSTVGGTNSQAPVSGYVDYLDRYGNQLASSSGAAYTRVWSITTNATADMKRITVVTVANSSASFHPASTTLVCLKNDQ